ncbi:MAG TPA: hypothetical protein VF077_05820 [Nitrospiraceae bacterium]
MTMTQQMQNLRNAEEARAIFKQMVAAGQQTLDPKSVKTLRALDSEIADARKRLGLKGKR